jgi:hypothetical protein
MGAVRIIGGCHGSSRGDEVRLGPCPAWFS